MDPFTIGGAIIGGLGSIFKGIFGHKQNKAANKINPVFNQYQANPFASKQLQLAQQLYGGRMAGAADAERNIYTGGANYLGQVGRNATDSSQALALAAAGLGQQGDQFANLQSLEAQNKQNMLGNLNAAYATNISEGDKVYNSMLQKYQMDVQQKNALRGAGMGNIYGGINDLSGMAFQLAQLKKK